MPATGQRRQGGRCAGVSNRASWRRRLHPRACVRLLAPAAKEQRSYQVLSWSPARCPAYPTPVQPRHTKTRNRTKPDHSPNCHARHKVLRSLSLRKTRGQTGFFQTLRFGPVLLVASCKTGRRCYYKYVSGAACRLDMVCPAGPHLFFKGQQFDCWPFALPRPSIAKLESFREETPSIPQVRPLANSEWTRCREAS